MGTNRWFTCKLVFSIILGSSCCGRLWLPVFWASSCLEGSCNYEVGSTILGRRVIVWLRGARSQGRSSVTIGRRRALRRWREQVSWVLPSWSHWRRNRPRRFLMIYWSESMSLGAALLWHHHFLNWLGSPISRIHLIHLVIWVSSLHPLLLQQVASA